MKPKEGFNAQKAKTKKSQPLELAAIVDMLEARRQIYISMSKAKCLHLFCRRKDMQICQIYY